MLVKGAIGVYQGHNSAYNDQSLINRPHRIEILPKPLVNAMVADVLALWLLNFINYVNFLLGTVLLLQMSVGLHSYLAGVSATQLH